MFSFGIFLVQINGSVTFSVFPSSIWQKEQTETNSLVPDVMLTIEKGILPRHGSAFTGWCISKADDRWLAVYSLDGKEQFALQYGKYDEAVKVIVADEYGNHVRLGVQFGLLLALYRQCVGFHGVTLLFGNEIIILSAPSGTGKTTLAKLLEKYSDAIVINGDFALLHPTKDGVIFEPTPFCGTSGRCLNHRFRVNRVVFLGQAKANTWRDLNGRESLQLFLQNTFVPTWDRVMRDAVQENIVKCLSMIRINHFSFAPIREAADVFAQHIMDG